MNDDSPALNLRGKMIGVLMRDARLARGQTPEACAGAMACSLEDYEAFELGDSSPSLPELELLAYNLNVPLAQFWGDKTLAARQEEAAARPGVPAGELADLRDRIIGSLLRQVRLAARLSQSALAVAAGLTADELEAIELGQAPVALPELERLAARLGVGLEHFLEAHGTVGEWVSQERAAERVRQLPPELRDFVSRPANEPYLRLAHQLSQLSNDRLRGLAETLLDITF